MSNSVSVSVRQLAAGVCEPQGLQASSDICRFGHLLRPKRLGGSYLMAAGPRQHLSEFSAHWDGDLSPTFPRYAQGSQCLNLEVFSSQSTEKIRGC